MLKASNNHFGGKSKIKIPKIRPFFNVKSTKIGKKCEKIYSAWILMEVAIFKYKKIYAKYMHLISFIWCNF